MSIINPTNVHALRLYVCEAHPQLIKKAQEHGNCKETATELLLDSVIWAVLYSTRFKEFDTTKKHLNFCMGQPYQRKTRQRQIVLLQQLKKSSVSKRRQKLSNQQIKITAIQREVFMSIYKHNLSITKAAKKYKLQPSQVRLFYNHVAGVLDYAVATMFV